MDSIYLAELMYPEFLKPTDVCADIGLCTMKALVGTPTCEDCKGTFNKVAEQIAALEQVKKIIGFLTVSLADERPSNSARFARQICLNF